MSSEQPKTFNGRNKAAAKFLYAVLLHVSTWACVCVSLRLFGISVKVGNRSAGEVQEQLPSPAHSLYRIPSAEGLNKC